jgi:hypothetical protein
MAIFWGGRTLVKMASFREARRPVPSSTAVLDCITFMINEIHDMECYEFMRMGFIRRTDMVHVKVSRGPPRPLIPFNPTAIRSPVHLQVWEFGGRMSVQRRSSFVCITAQGVWETNVGAAGVGAQPMHGCT